jgi:hypothetical protein
MNPVTYDELGRMRLGGFLDDGVELDVEETGMMTLVGLGGFERLGETYFCWKQGEPYHTAGIELDLGPDTILPEESARGDPRAVALASVERHAETRDHR